MAGNEGQQNPLEAKLDGDGIPDELKGKTVKELLAARQNLTESLRLSETRRTELENAQRAAAVASQAPPPPPPPKEEPELTDEQLAELHQKNPIEAIRYMQAQAARTAERNLERRIGPLMTGSASSAEQSARAKYPDEFQLFGDQIERLKNDPKVSKEALASPQAWDDMIAYIRGKPENIDKLFDHRVSKNKPAAQAAAQAAQAAAAGATIKPDLPTQSRQTGSDDLDDTTKEIARTLFPELKPAEAYAEYNKWRKVS